MKRNSLFVSGATVFLFLAGLIGYGWVCNIIALATTNEDTVMTVARAVGLFVIPLGAVLGFL
jgi:hypothetical protein